MVISLEADANFIFRCHVATFFSLLVSDYLFVKLHLRKI
jgi:hypothetical protein